MTLRAPDGRTVRATIVDRAPLLPVLTVDGAAVSTSEARRYSLVAWTRLEAETTLWSEYRFTEAPCRSAR